VVALAAVLAALLDAREPNKADPTIAPEAKSGMIKFLTVIGECLAVQVHYKFSSFHCSIRAVAQ
jgi:hypothetical protein